MDYVIGYGTEARTFSIDIPVR